MSRAQLMERARRLGMRTSLRAEPGFGVDCLTRFRLTLALAGASSRTACAFEYCAQDAEKRPAPEAVLTSRA